MKRKKYKTQEQRRKSYNMVTVLLTDTQAQNLEGARDWNSKCQYVSTGMLCLNPS